MKKKILAFSLIFIILFTTLYNVAAISYTADNPTTLQQNVIDALRDRETNISIKYYGTSNGIEVILNSILSYDEYLKYTIQLYKWRYSGYENDLDIKIEATHLLTKEKEIAATEKIRTIISNLITEQMTTHEKIKIIHDYIVKNTAYDTESKYRTHYDALFIGKTVCHGYALLFHQFMTELNIPVRLVVGETDESHIWNMVMVDQNWFHIDVTYADPVPDQGESVSYQYYMLTEEQITESHKITSSPIPKSVLSYDYLISRNLDSTENSLYSSLLKDLELSYIPPTPEDIEETPPLDTVKILSLGQYVPFNEKYGWPYIDLKNRTQVPFRITIESTGAEVFWEEKTRTAIAVLGKNIVRVPVGEAFILVNGEYRQNDTVATIKNGRVYLPIRIVAEALGFKVDWVQETKTVLIK